MPESVRDRPSSAWEHIWMFSKSPRYFYDQDAVREKHSAATTDTGQRRRMIAAGKFSTEDEYAGRATGQRGGVGERMLKLNEAGANLRNFWLVATEPLTKEQQWAQFMSFAEDYLGEEAFDSMIDAFNEGMDGCPPSEYWLLSPEMFKGEHYAAFPTEIPRRCILAGTSEKGQCPTCGAPWVRLTERGYIATPKACKGVTTRSDAAAAIAAGDQGARRARDGHIKGLMRSNTTLGWQPSCSCPPADPIPQTVLDPFGGAGTVGLVANRLGRRAVLVELNPEYCDLARRRIEADAGTLFGPPAAVTPARQPGLFEEAM